MPDVVYPVFLANFSDCRRALCPYCPAYPVHSHDPSFAIRILEHKRQDRTHIHLSSRLYAIMRIIMTPLSTHVDYRFQDTKMICETYIIYYNSLTIFG